MKTNIACLLVGAISLTLASAQTATNAPTAADDYAAQLRQRLQSAATTNAPGTNAPAVPDFPRLPVPTRGTNANVIAVPLPTNAAPRIAAGTTAGAVAPGAAAATTVANPTAEDATPKPAEIAEVSWVLPEVPIEQALQMYSELVGRQLLKAAATPQAPGAPPGARIYLKTQRPLTKSEAILALETSLGMNGIGLVPIGEKFVKVLNEAAAGTAGGEISERPPGELPDAGRFITHIVQLKYAQVSEVQNAIAPFAKGTANSIVPIPSSQTIVLRDYTENVKRMLEVIAKIDVVSPVEVKPEVIKIKYALADDIAQVLGSLTASGAGVSVGRQAQRSGVPGTPGYTPPATTPGGINPLTGQPTPAANTAFGANAATQRSAFQQRLQGIIQRAATGGDFQILGQTKIISDARTNSLLIFANDQDMTMIKDIIDKLDVVLAQVLIEAIIMEVSLDNGRNLGVSMQQRPQQTGKLTTAGGENNGQNFLGSLTNLASGANGLPAGFSYFGTYGNDFDFAVTAIATDNRVNVLSRPRVQTSHAVPAELFIGQTVPYITGTINDINGGARSQYTAQQIGIHLNVTPLINPDGLVVMDIVQQIQQLGTPQRIDNNDVPTTTDRNATAKVAVRDRDTIVLGGFISSSSTRSRSGVPWLKDIPIIGAAFRSESKNHQRVELIAMIRPTVLPTPESAALQATMEKDRLPGVKAAELESVKDEAKRREKYESELRKSQ